MDTAVELELSLICSAKSTAGPTDWYPDWGEGVQFSARPVLATSIVSTTRQTMLMSIATAAEVHMDDSPQHVPPSSSSSTGKQRYCYRDASSNCSKKRHKNVQRSSEHVSTKRHKVSTQSSPSWARSLKKSDLTNHTFSVNDIQWIIVETVSELLSSLLPDLPEERPLSHLQTCKLWGTSLCVS